MLNPETTGETPAEFQIEETADIAEIKRRSIRGIFSLLLRTGILQMVAIVATFLLTIFLDPAVYGVFGIVAAVVDILVYFSDIGLAAALIQKKNITREDLSTTFIAQQILSVLLLLIGFLAVNLVSGVYTLSPAGIWLFKALLISFFLSSLKTIPSIRLERKLEFGKLIIPQILENVVFYVTAVFLAWKGFGISAFTIAIIFRSVVGLIAIYLISPWKPSLHFNKESFKSLVSFGAPFQINSLLGLVKDRLLVVYYGAILPAANVGYLQWAERWSLFPLRIVVDNVNKVTFPAYSRLQDSKQHLVTAIEKSIFFTALIIFPILIGMIILAPSFIAIIPKYQKWQPALLALTFFAINGLWSSISTTITNTFAAIGKIKINFKLMIMWTTLTWIFTPLLISKTGYNGVAIASALVATSSIVPMIIIKKLLPIHLAKNILPQLVSSLLMGFCIYWLITYLPFTSASWRIPLTILIGVILYFALIFLFTGKKLIQEFRAIKQLTM